MAFESLTEKLQNVFRNLRGKGKLSEADVKLALKEVKLALLEADVNFKVVKKFIADVQERAVGTEVMNSLTPAQQVVKIVNEELIKLIGEDTKELELKSGDAVNVIMMMGLQGAGKTTTAAKLAGKLKSKGFSPLLVACDIYRPAAIDQLKINAEKQDAVNVAENFNSQLNIDGVVLTKLDGDTRGGAALSIKAVTKKPILYAGMGEKLSDLEVFHPDRMAGRILGMGDILSLIEKVEMDIDAEKAKEMSQKFKKAEFDFNDFLDQMKQLKKMGGIASLLNMLPGMQSMKGAANVDDSQMARVEAIILSMTLKERSNPDILNPSRKNRIAKGAGVDIAEVNRIVKQFDQMKKMMKQLSGSMNQRGARGLGGLFGGGKKGFPF